MALPVSRSSDSQIISNIRLPRIRINTSSSGIMDIASLYTAAELFRIHTWFPEILIVLRLQWLFRYHLDYIQRLLFHIITRNAIVFTYPIASFQIKTLLCNHNFPEYAEMYNSYNPLSVSRFLLLYTAVFPDNPHSSSWDNNKKGSWNPALLLSYYMGNVYTGSS